MPKFNKENFIPVLLGSDAGAYGMARSFYEKYNIKTICLDHKDLVFCRYSEIVDTLIIEDLENDNCFVNYLIDFSKGFVNRKLLLMAFTDSYAELLIKHKKELESYYIIPTINYELYKSLAYKDNFYSLCEENELDYPKTIVITYDNFKEHKISKKTVDSLGYPLVLKPADSSKYWKTDFSNKKKAYKIKTYEALLNTIEHIYESNYHSNLILQEFIDGPNEENYILNCYSNSKGKVQYMCMGNVLLEEKGPTGIGSPTAIIDYYDEELMGTIKKFLEKINYVGFSNFDFKYDKKKKKLLIFEINLRLGRSSYYANNETNNLSEMVINDFIYKKTSDFTVNKTESLWCIIPETILFEWIIDDEKSDKVYHLIRSRKCINSLIFEEDMNEERKRLLDLKMIKYMDIYKYYKNNKEIKDEIL